MPRKRITIRTAERLGRAAFEFEHLANVFAGEGMASYAQSLRNISSQLGNLGCRLDEKLTTGA